MGGQTALNTALTLNRTGVLDKYGVEMIGAKAHVIDKAEDRDLFRTAMHEIGLETPKSAFVNTSELKRRFETDYRSRLEEIGKSAGDQDEREAAIADFDAETTPPRIGLHGTAKIYGHPVPLAFYLFRRPIASARRMLGF